MNTEDCSRFLLLNLAAESSYPINMDLPQLWIRCFVGCSAVLDSVLKEFGKEFYSQVT